MPRCCRGDVAAVARPFHGLWPECPSNRIHLAAIGCGGPGDCRLWRRFCRWRMCGSSPRRDCRQSRREAFARMANNRYQGKICTAYRDFRDVLARKDVDGVVVSTPISWHVPGRSMQPERAKTCTWKNRWEWPWPGRGNFAKKWPSTRSSSSTAHSSGVIRDSFVTPASWCATATWVKSTALTLGAPTCRRS